jgi:hypothetical protein
MAPLQEAAAGDGLAVVVLRHDRKSGGDVGDSGRGSSAFSGAVDVVLQLSRPEGQSRPGVRALKSLSRFDETPETLVIELTEAGYVALWRWATPKRSPRRKLGPQCSRPHQTTRAPP